MRSFYKAAFIALGVIIALLAVAAPLYAQLGSFPPPADVVKYDSGTKRHYFTPEVGLEVIILNRAEIYVTAAEDGSAKQSIYGNSLSYKDALEGAAEGRGTIFRNPNLSDGRFHYEHDARVGEDADAYKSQILELDTGALNRDAKGNIGSLPFTKRVNTANFFDKYMKDAEIRLKLSDASLPDDVANCGGNASFGIGRDSRWTLVQMKSQALWRCIGGIGDPTDGIFLKSDQVKQVENFNVVYKYDGANTLEYVSSDGGDNKDFIYCDETTTNPSQGDKSVRPAFVRGRSCASSEYIDVKPADLAGRSGIYTLTVKDTGSDATMEVGVIPADDPSQSPAEQVNQAIAGLAANPDNLENCQSGDGIDGAFGWIICPVVSMILNSIDWMEDKIISYLVINPLEATDGNVIFELWKSIRNLSNILLIIAFLLLIYSQVTSTGLDAYQVKKLAPRLLIATIGIQLSFYLAAFLIDIFNIFGAGVGTLVASVLAQQDDVARVTVDGFAGPLVILLTLGAIFQRDRIFKFGLRNVGMSPVVGFFFLLALIVAGAFITVLFRQMLIILLVIAAPVAMVASLLPNTADFYKKWQSTFVKALMMYPIIVLLFASGKLFGVVAALADANPNGTTTSGSFMSFFANIIPLLFVPFAFRFAGGALARIGDFALKRGEGLRRATSDRNSMFMQGLNEDDDELRRQLSIDRAERIGLHGRKSSDETFIGRKLSRSRRLGGAFRGYDRARNKALDFGKSKVPATISQARSAAAERRQAQSWEEADNYMKLRQNGHWPEAQRWFAQYGGNKTQFAKGLERLEREHAAGKVDRETINNYKKMGEYVGRESYVKAAYHSAAANGKLKNVETALEVAEGYGWVYKNEETGEYLSPAAASTHYGRVIDASKLASKKNPLLATIGIDTTGDATRGDAAGKGRATTTLGTQKPITTDEAGMVYAARKPAGETYGLTASNDHAGADFIRSVSHAVNGIDALEDPSLVASGVVSGELAHDMETLGFDSATKEVLVDKAARTVLGMGYASADTQIQAQVELGKALADTSNPARQRAAQVIKARMDELGGRPISEGDLPPDELLHPPE